jgi:hypothetical protein
MPNEVPQKPERIYKYVSMEVAKVVLANKTLKFSKPSTFNDPYDCDVDLVDFNFNGNIHPRVLEEIDALKKTFGNYLESRPQAFWEMLYKEAQLEKINGMRISCFSLVNDNVLMWSHYAKHDGVCLEFNNIVKKKFVNLIDEIDISEGVVGYNQKERINYLAEDRAFAIYQLYFCKSQSWEYEKEFRMILLNNKNEIQQFHEEFLIGVYFGINTTKAEIDSIVNLCDQVNLKHLQFYTARKEGLSLKFINQSR